jgi:L-ascorbate metabolism protein UlaG (beta-lactamase superfamily)
MKRLLLVSVLVLVFVAGCVGQEKKEYDAFRSGNITIKWFGHSTFEITSWNSRIYTDPFALESNFTTGEFVLISHNHSDHCDVEKTKLLIKNDVNVTRTDLKTHIFGTIDCVRKINGSTYSMVPGDEVYFGIYNIRIIAVPEYNIGKEYHPQDSGVGYIIEIDNQRIYFAGDTDIIPEMANFTNIDIAILPIGGKYTMNVQEAAQAARIIKPKAVIPMHYNSGDLNISDINADPFVLQELLKNTGIKVVVLKNL